MELDSPIHTRIKEARVRDLEQRVADLETLLSRPRVTDEAIPRLRSLYLDARLGKIEYSPSNALMWEISMRTLTRQILYELGVNIGEPFVWRWFMETTLEFSWRGYDMDEVYEHLRSLAKEVLHIQGFRVLGIGDGAYARTVTSGKNRQKITY